MFWTEKSGRIKEAQRGLKRVGWIVPMLLLFVSVYFWPHWVSVAMDRLSLIAVNRGCSQAVMSGLLVAVASLVAEHGL